MTEKLNVLLDQMNWNDRELFQDGKLLKIVGDNKKERYCFYIELENILPHEVFHAFTNRLKQTYPHHIVELRLFIQNLDWSKFAAYYVFFIEKYSETYPLLSLLKGNPVSLDGEIATIKVANFAEERKLSSILPELEKDMHAAGFLHTQIKVEIDQTESLKIQEEINKNLRNSIPADKIKKAEPETTIIMGTEIKSKYITMDALFGEENDITLEAFVFGVDMIETKKGFKIFTLKLTDYTDSIYCKIFVREDEQAAKLKKSIKEGNWYLLKGYTKNDTFSNELVFFARDINTLKKSVEKVTDDAPVKRVELHAHTFMSQMDGLIEPKKLIKEAYKRGYKAIAITDHNGAQAYPDVFKTVKGINKELKEGEEPFKAIYGTELIMVDDRVNIVIRGDERSLLETEYVVFDVETTGFNAGGADSIIEIGAVKIVNGEIMDRFSRLINPGRPLPAKITEITKITDEMLRGKPSEEDSVKEFIDWFGTSPLVAHNAKFDISFLEMAYRKYGLGTFTNTVIDTLELSRTMDNTYARHGLSALVKRYDVTFDENAHHRADYDAEATALVFHKMLKKLMDRNFKTVEDINNLVAKDEIHKYGRTYHVNILAKNRDGLKNLFKMVSLANTKYLHKTPRIPRSELERLREGVLVGSGCYESEIFVEARSKSEEELANLVNFYDYVEIQPPECYDHLLQMGDFGSKSELFTQLMKMIRVVEDSGVLLVATGDVHHLNPDDKKFREIIVNQKVPGGGRHPLARNNIISIPSMHLRTTEEMLDSFSFLPDEDAYRYVVENTNKIADMIEIYEVIPDTKGIPFSPKMENSEQIVKDMVYDNAKAVFGEPLPSLVETRIEQELKGIIGGGYDVIYLIAQKLVKKSNDEGYLVGSRGSIGSSYVATLMGITEVNPLPPHYVCSKCKYSTFEEDGKLLGSLYPSGYDLPRKTCPNCNENLIREGLDMPFATFLGFNADKVPDIDLNFSGDYQPKAHEYTKELFGVDNVYRAGTIGTVADKTAFGFVKGYMEDKGITGVRSAEIERLAMGCTGVKRTTGQHPGGIVVVPDYMEVFEVTPFQYPADDGTKAWRTTHFDYHSFEECLLKLDILGHDDPTTLRMLQDLSGIDVTKVDFMDPDVIGLFSSPKPLGINEEQIMCPTGTLGLPELGTNFLLGMISETKPKTFAELLKISGLSHGTDVWLGNAQELIRNGTVEFKDVIGCRDDIMVYLSYQGLEPGKAFKIMEFVRKGMPSKNPDGWREHVATMKEAGIADWYIESCGKIKYMFPKAHAAAYVMSALRIAWFKVHMPIMYYAAYFSVRCWDFDIESMIAGYETIKKRILEIQGKGFEASNKENSIYDVSLLALEATARNIRFANIDLNRSDAINFVIADDYTLIPPFRTIDGLGDTVAKKIVEEREKGEFLSIEDLQKRGKVSGTLIEKMRSMGVLNGLDESSQLTLF